jgi:hypothetical protein
MAGFFTKVQQPLWRKKLKKRIVTRGNLPRIVLGTALLLLVTTAAALIIDLNRPVPTWYVEPGLEAQWEELLEKAPTPPPYTHRRYFDPGAGIKKGHYGIIITKDFPEGAANNNTPSSPEDPWAPPLRLYPGLYQDRAGYQGAIPLALDPWIVLRKTTDPPLSLERVLNSAGGTGALILPGAEPEATFAWITQLLQRSPGSFPQEKQAWEDAEQLLVYGNNRFQQGALTYTWFDAWIKLLQNETAWLYAPLSRTRGIASYDAGRLDAAIFPLPPDWNSYGLQAEILWAIPAASEEQAALLDEAKLWLSAVETQTSIAGILGWIPAQPGGKPYDTIARQAQLAWFSSSFIWQKVVNSQEN